MAFRRYDLEAFIKEIKSILQPVLGAELTKITTEKADNMTLPDPAADAWHIDKLPKSFNKTPFVVYGFEKISKADSTPHHDLKSVTAYIEVCLADKNDQDNYFRALRYMRALNEVAQKNTEKFSNGVKPSIGELLPAFITPEPKTRLLCTGITLTIILS